MKLGICQMPNSTSAFLEEDESEFRETIVQHSKLDHKGIRTELHGIYYDLYSVNFGVIGYYRFMVDLKRKGFKMTDFYGVPTWYKG